MNLADRCFRIGCVGLILIGIISAIYLTVRPSASFRTIEWLPRFLDPISQWADYHGRLRNVPAYLLLATPFLVLFRDPRVRSKLIATLALFAAVLECTQEFIPTRFFEWQDIALSWVGLILAWSMAESAHWFRSQLRRSLYGVRHFRKFRR